VGLRLAAGTRQVAKSGKQRCEVRRVLLCDGCEFESKTVTRLNMPHDRLGADLAFLDKKIEPGFRAYRPLTWGSKKQTFRALVVSATKPTRRKEPTPSSNQAWRSRPVRGHAVQETTTIDSIVAAVMQNITIRECILLPIT